MRRTVAWFSLVGCFAAGVSHHGVAQDESSQSTIATVNGHAIEEAEYVRWLLDTHGWRFVEDYIVLTLFRQAAAEQELTMTAAELDEAFERHWDDQVLFRFDGDEAAFHADLATGNIDKAGYKRRQLAKLEWEELGRRLVLKNRTATQKEVNQLYQELCPDGKRTHLRVAFFNRFRDLQPTQQPSSDTLAKLDAATKVRAEEFLAAVMADPSVFGAKAAESSDVLKVQRYDNYQRDLRQSGGDVPYYQPKLFRGALEGALAADREDGTIVGPVFSSAGFYVFQVVGRADVALEDVKADLEQILLTRNPTGREIYAMREKLLEKAEIER